MKGVDGRESEWRDRENPKLILIQVHVRKSAAGSNIEARWRGERLLMVEKPVGTRTCRVGG
jgi:hypothetical protein